MDTAAVAHAPSGPASGHGPRTDGGGGGCCAALGSRVLPLAAPGANGGDNGAGGGLHGVPQQQQQQAWAAPIVPAGAVVGRAEQAAGQQPGDPHSDHQEQGQQQQPSQVQGDPGDKATGDKGTGAGADGVSLEGRQAATGEQRPHGGVLPPGAAAVGPPGEGHAEQPRSGQSQPRVQQPPEGQLPQLPQQQPQQQEQAQAQSESQLNPGGAGPGGADPEGAVPDLTVRCPTGDPDYEIPRGLMTETQVLLSLAQQRQQQSRNRPLRVDKYGFVLGSVTSEDQGAEGANPDADAGGGGGSRRRTANGGDASTSGRGDDAATRTTPGMALALGPALRELDPEALAELWQQRQRRRRQHRVERRWVGRVCKWRKMLGQGGAAFEECRRRRAAKLKRRVRKGIPDQLRGLAWLMISGGHKLLSQHPGAFAVLASDETAASGLTAEAAAAAGLGDHSGGGGAAAAAGPVGYGSLDPAVDSSIMRDLNRTFPNHIYFMQRQGPGQRALYTVLRAYAVYDPGVGYVQGMGFIAAVLLLYLDAEEAFWTLVALMQGPSSWSGSDGLKRLYTPGMPGLQCCLYQFKHLLRDAVPLLADRMEREGVDPSLYATHWFNTAFAYTLPFDHLLRVWDVFLAEGMKTIFRVGLAVLQHAEPRLAPLPFEALVEALSAKNLPALLPPDPEDLLRRALRLRVSRRLSELRAEWAAAQRSGQQPKRAGVADGVGCGGRWRRR